ncbi:MAG: Hint domain-containing homing endonuclease [Promethearchaeota archaeon]
MTATTEKFKYWDSKLVVPGYHGKIEVVAGPMFAGKCLARDTPILMHDGTIKMVQDIHTTDVLMGDDSTGRNVLGICKGYSELFKVTSSFGDVYVVNEDHVLSLKCSHTPKNCIGKPHTRYQKGKVKNICVRDYIEESKTFKSYYKGYRVGVKFEEKHILLDPYILGVWLGDGSADEPVICNSDEEVISKIFDFAKSCGLKVNKYENSSKARPSWYLSCRKPNGTNPLLLFLDQLGVRRNKHIPHIYKTNSREIRLQLLAGLIDTNGYCSGPKRHSYEITLKIKTLADDITYLARSLGMVAYSSEVQKSWTYNGVKKLDTYHRVYISGSNLHEIPCHVKHKKAVKYINQNDLLVGIKVESVGWGEYYGFETDGNHLFLLGDFTVTHNSSELLRRVKMHRHATKKCLVLKPKMDVRHTNDDGKPKESVITHDGYEMDAMMCTRIEESFSFCFGPDDKHDVVAIDEGQFFPDLAESCETLANLGVIVIVACLIGSIERKFMGDVAQLLPIADKITMVRSICSICRDKKAAFTKEIVAGTVGPTCVKIGGSESYIPVCRQCFFIKKREKLLAE